MKVDTILTNGNIYTIEPSGNKAEAVAICEGNIVAVGTTNEIRLQYSKSAIKEIDLEGQTVIPGLVDSHLHLANYGMFMQMLNLTGLRSYEALVDAIRKRASETPQGEWIVAVGFDENLFPDKRIPDCHELDKITANHPIFLVRICSHAYVVNSLALKIAEIGERTSDPNGGTIGRDHSGQPNGRLYENAHLLVYKHIPTPTYTQIKDALRSAIHAALRSGLTGVHVDELRTIGSISDMLKMYRELVVEEGLRLRSNQLIYHPFMDEFAALGLKTGDGDEWISIGAMKVFADGAFGGRTALLSSPYNDDPSTSGVSIHTQDDLNELVALARKHDMSFAVHTIGDKAVDMVIKAIHSQGPFRKHRDRIIHAQSLTAELVEQLASLHAIIDIQPRFLASDFPWVQDRLGQDRLPYAYAWKTLIDKGIHCAGGSDAPIEPIEPLLGIHAAVTRTKPGEPNTVYLPDQKLTVKQAVQLFTSGPAFVTGEDHIKGTIAVGKKADFTVLADDLFTMNPNDIYKAIVTKTIIGGMIIFEK